MKELKLLFIGNSFAEDTMEHAAGVARSLGVEKMKLGVLFFGGCPIEMHYQHTVEDLAVYSLRINEGDGWHSTPEFTVDEAVKMEKWDYIAIQHGTKNGNRYTSPECYEKLTPLIEHVRSIAQGEPKIIFNLTWMGESTKQHHEILSYGGDISAMRAALEDVTREVILGNPNVDILAPTGTAIENARTTGIGLLTRDCYHLSVDKGRYIAALTFMSCVLGVDAGEIDWMPEGVGEYAREVAIAAARAAIKNPLKVTKLDI